HENTKDGRKLVTDLEQAAVSWLDANLETLALGEAGKGEQALTLYREASIPNVGPVQQSLASYLEWERPRMTEREERANRIIRLMPIPIAALTLAALAISGLLGMAVTRSIATPLNVAVSHLGEVAQ